MKKLAFLLFVSGTLLLPFFCQGKSGKMDIVATTYPLYIFTRNIVKGAENVRSSLLISPGRGCPHDYALTPKDMQKLAGKNLLLIRNGAGMDDFVLKVMKKINPASPVLDSSRGIPLLPANGSECKEAHHKHHCHDDHHHHDSGNPHLFASPFTAEQVVKNIVEFLALHDPANAPLYRKNGSLYRKKLLTLGETGRKTLEPFAGEKFIAQHNIFDYFAAFANLKCAGYLSAGSAAPGAKLLTDLAKKIRKEKIRLILTEPQYPDGSARRLARECKIAVVHFDPVATGPALPPDDYYEKTMLANLKLLKEALQK